MADGKKTDVSREEYAREMAVIWLFLAAAYAAMIFDLGQSFLAVVGGMCFVMFMVTCSSLVLIRRRRVAKQDDTESD